MGRIEVKHLKAGMVLAEPIFSTDKKLLLQTGTRLTSAIAQNLMRVGISEVQIADQFTLIMDPNERVATLLEQNMQTIIEKVVPNYVEGNKSDAMVEIASKVKKIITKIVKWDDVLGLCLQILTMNNNILFIHSVNTSVLSMLVAGAMGLSDKDIYNIGVAALLQDLGACEMPFLIEKQERNTQEQLLWMEHPTYGYYFAIQNNITFDVANLILSHHEHVDGSGYPKKLQGERIPLGARIINMCCEYDDAVTIQGKEPYEAIEYLYCLSGRYYDKEVVTAFTNNIAIYPLGSIVRLTTKEVGVVVNVRANQGPRPLVMVYINRVNKPLSVSKMVDLGKEKTIFIEKIIGI